MPTPLPTPSVNWARIIAAISDARARAFTSLHDDDLAAVYAPSSPLLTRDRATLRALRTDGLRIRGHPPALVVVGTQPITAARDAVVLHVVELAASYQIVDADGRVVRDNKQSGQRRLAASLVRVGQRWLVATLDPQTSSYGGGPRR